MAAKVGDTWYRIEERNYVTLNDWDEVVSRRVELIEIKFRVCKLTPSGVRLVHEFSFVDGYSPKHARFVNLTSRKKYAHPTREAAYEGFIARKTAQERILTAQLRGVTYVKDKALVVMASMKAAEPKPDVMLA